MKLNRLLVIIAAIMLVCSAVAFAQEKPWFDMQNCSFCKNLLTDPKLLENMTWDQYDISNGMISVTTVTPEFMESYKKVMDEIEKVSQELSKGRTDLPMCGSCEYYGKMMFAGVKFETIPTKVGEITLVTSDKPEGIDMIRKYAQRSREEMAKMMVPEKPKE